MDEEIRDFLEGLAHGPCAGVDYKQFADYCQRQAKLLLTKDDQKKYTTRQYAVCTCDPEKPYNPCPVHHYSGT